ncbi:HNH endonuclease [Rhodohalobacter halophilus]|uniref:HNH endonuclease n=1 Tax=Rhodohalobacter halophilus TaxID=1812810 RepID=UPI00083FA54E|nr:HNH endonuclease [Rhodohalobacter halophilus]
MKFYIGVTDDNWFHFLAQQQPDEVNFWRPRDKSNFKVIQEGAPFLFKLHSPNNFIVGGGFFVKHLFLPLSLTWDAFGIKNGAATYDQFRQSIMKFRQGEGLNPTIGSTILTEPFFFERQDWIPIPENWSKNIVKGKSYSTDEPIGSNVWRQVKERLDAKKYREGELAVEEPETRYGNTYELRSRIGQSAFRAMVTDAYKYRCAITKEKTLPVLEAAHIKPYSEAGPNLTKNGLLLRSDMHILFDKGYMTVTNDHIVEVSRRIREEYENGKEYYAWHGKKLQNLPEHNLDQPATDYLQWHQQEIYLG